MVLETYSILTQVELFVHKRHVLSLDKEFPLGQAVSNDIG